MSFNVPRVTVPFNGHVCCQKQTCATHERMFGHWQRQGSCPLWVKSGQSHCNRTCPLYPPESDNGGVFWDVRFGPKAGNLNSFDHKAERITHG
jgi:hypothetical protein